MRDSNHIRWTKTALTFLACSVIEQTSCIHCIFSYCIAMKMRFKMLPALAIKRDDVCRPLASYNCGPHDSCLCSTVTSENSNAWVCQVKMVFVTCFKTNAMLVVLFGVKNMNFDTRCFAIFPYKYACSG